MSRLYAGIAIALTLLFASCASQPKPPQPADQVFTFEKAPLFGMIYDADNEPCPDAQLTVDGAKGPITDIRGRFILAELARGEHTLVASKPGFETFTQKFNFLDRTDVLYVRLTSFDQLLSAAERAMDERRWDVVQANLERAAALDKANPVLLYLRAILAFKTDKFDEAERDLKTLVDKGNKEPHVYLFLADIYQYHLNQPELAIQNLQSYLSLRGDPDARKRLDDLKGQGSGATAPAQGNQAPAAAGDKAGGTAASSASAVKAPAPAQAGGAAASSAAAPAVKAAATGDAAAAAQGAGSADAPVDTPATHVLQPGDSPLDPMPADPAAGASADPAAGSGVDPAAGQ